MILPTALAAAMSGTATRMISHPAAARVQIWWRVASTSSVRVLVIDWMVTGAPPPMGTPPTMICLVMKKPPLQAIKCR